MEAVKSEDLVGTIKSLLPNLKEDERFEAHKKHHRQGSWYVAREIVSEAKSSDEFQRVEVISRDPYLHRKMIYVIGYGTLDSLSKDTPALFYLERWNEERPHERRYDVKVLKLSRLISLLF